MPTSPRAPQRPHAITRHGDTRIDPYYWLMNKEDPEVLAHLAAENEHTAEMLAPQAELRETVMAEFRAHIEETDISVPVRRRDYWVYERTLEGLNYGIACRLPAEAGDLTPPEIDPLNPPANEQVMYDENVEATGHDFHSTGIFSVSPDDAWVAVGTDVTGDELHHVTFRPLNVQAAPSDEIENVSYGCTWSADSTYFFYTRVDDALRPFQIWRHELGTDSSGDVLVHEELDPEYTIAVGRSLSHDMLYLSMSSSMTTELWYLDGATPTGDFRVFEPRRHGVEYDAEHFTDAAGQGWWIKVTNEEAKDFRALIRRERDGEWRELIAHRPGTRLDGIELFATCFVIVERFEGQPSVRIVSLLEGDDPFGADVLERAQALSAGAKPSAVFVSANPEFHTPLLRVQMTSMITPRLVADIVVATGERLVRKQQIVKGGYVEADYVSSQRWVRASDGVLVPVTVVAKRGTLVPSDDGTLVAPSPAPMVLYGYGSYEASMDPFFSAMRLSLLDRGVIFAIAHVRGGGELGRTWYEMGRLDQKATSFSDFVAVARDCIDAGLTTPAQLAARGGSAGGLLMGAVMNLAPELFRAVLAEVPFVDSLTTMLDASLPLTIGEWEEWGNPDASADTYRIMKGYSPYDNVSPTNPDGSERVYPHLLALAGLNDSRVGFWEPTKWVQKLRDANEKNVVYLKVEMGAGHGGPSGRYDAWRDEAMSLAFLLSEIGAA